MSSAPMTNGGSIAGVRVVGCPQTSLVSSALNPSGESEASPQTSELSAPQSPQTSNASPSPHSGNSQNNPDELNEFDTRRASATPSDRDPAASENKSDMHHRTDSAAQSSHLVCSTPSAIGKSKTGDAQESDKPAMHFHRVREVRLEQGVSPRSMARRLNMDVRSYKRLEEPTEDLPLSTLHRIQQALDVPLCDLLVQNEGLSRPVEERAKMVKTMKTAVAIREAKGNARIQRLADMLCEQLVDLMPELKDVGGWPQFGARRGKSALGRALCEPIDMSQLRTDD